MSVTESSQVMSLPTLRKTFRKKEALTLALLPFPSDVARFSRHPPTDPSGRSPAATTPPRRAGSPEGVNGAGETSPASLLPLTPSPSFLHESSSVIPPPPTPAHRPPPAPRLRRRRRRLAARPIRRPSPSCRLPRPSLYAGELLLQPPPYPGGVAGAREEEEVAGAGGEGLEHES
uniref:Uncharacterized protein n=1 Tax=Oryza sativa subsp. japonica TaxID=39947 RepID=Q5Z5E1_ORYSJ|nr:hypothetical protein [Oryza sativa Japonica Group]BAD54628.1 hypothetical protein [Oryza sativa Japonica Group]